MRKRLSTLLQSDAGLHAPGAYDAFSALLIERAGFDALYLSGASISYSLLGRPDIGLVSMAEVRDVIARIADRVSIPMIVDGDTGFGNALNVQRTVRTFERAGASAIQLEDQSLPKRCGHLDNKALVSAPEMVGKIKAALDARSTSETLIIARTDAIAVEGFDAALARARLYAEAGADVLFVEAPETVAQMEAICAEFAQQVPLLANMVEGGKTPVLERSTLTAMGYRLIISPGAIMRAQTVVIESLLAHLREQGSTMAWREKMLDFMGLNERLGLKETLAEAASYDESGPEISKSL